MGRFNGEPVKRIVDEVDPELFASLAMGDVHPDGGTVLSKSEPNELELCDSESKENCARCKEAIVCPFYNSRLRI